MALAIVGILPITMPIDYGSYFAFLLAASALVLSPGPDTVLIIRNTLSSGKTVGLATVAGIQMGLVVHTLLAVAGNGHAGACCTFLVLALTFEAICGHILFTCFCLSFFKLVNSGQEKR